MVEYYPFMESFDTDEEVQHIVDLRVDDSVTLCGETGIAFAPLNSLDETYDSLGDYIEQDQACDLCVSVLIERHNLPYEKPA